VVHYRHWNAHSVFFFDPAGNVVEYIARHDLKNGTPGDFGSADILYASEIAFVVDDVSAEAGRLREAVGLGEYTGTSDQFAALGDAHGLLLVMKRGRLISFEAAERKTVSVFPTVATVRGARPSKYVLPEFPYEITVEG
jgi:catechol-2,3-dioxygenase